MTTRGTPIDGSPQYVLESRDDLAGHHDAWKATKQTEVKTGYLAKYARPRSCRRVLFHKTEAFPIAFRRFMVVPKFHPSHYPSHWTILKLILVLKAMVTWDLPMLGNRHSCSCHLWLQVRLVVERLRCKAGAIGFSGMRDRSMSCRRGMMNEYE